MFAVFAEDAPPLAKGVDGQHRLDASQDELQGLESQISQLQARRVELAAEVQAMQQLSGMTAAAWLAWAGGLTPKEAGRACHLAKRLRKLPAIAEAFADGRLSEGVVASMVAVATPENEQILIGLSEIATGAQLQTLFRDYRRQSTKEPKPADEYVSYGADPESGLWKLNAGLTPEHGAEVEAALRAARESVDETTPEHDERCEQPDEQPTASAVDALLAMATNYLAGTTTRAGVVPDRFQSLIHIEEGRDAYLHNGCGTLDPDVVEEKKCDGTVGAIVKRRGNVVTIVSPTRLATRDQILALKARDRCCVFPGCGRQNFLIAHHVIHHADGGETHIYNLVLLCKPHHRLVHRPGWRIALNTDATQKRFFRPDGTEVKAVNARAGPAPPPPPGPRNTGTGERLTAYGRDILLHHWLTHEETGNPSDN